MTKLTTIPIKGQEARKPELDKLAEVNDEMEVVLDFLRWLTDSDFMICEWSRDEQEYISSRVNASDLVNNFFDIDQELVEKERQELLAKIREKNEKS